MEENRNLKKMKKSYLNRSKQYNSIIGEINKINIKRIYYVGMGIIFVSLVVLIYCLFFVTPETIEQVKWRRGLFTTYFVLLLLMIMIVSLIFYFQRKKNVSKLIFSIQYVMVGTIIISGSMLSVFAQLTNTSIMPFLIGCILIGSLFIIRPIVAVLIYLLGYGVIFYFMGFTQFHEGILISNRINGLAIIAMSACLSFVLWKANVVNIQQGQLIQQQQEDLKDKNKELQMAFLQSQIKPHFLYNTLNTIMYFCYIDDSKKAAELLESLCEYLHKSFDLEGMEESVNIGREMELTKAYLHIEQARFGNRLEVIQEVDESLFEEKILPLTIQPLVENAIKHGLMPRSKGGYVKISVMKEGNDILISVEDNGIGISSDEMEEQVHNKSSLIRERTGVGLENIRKRLNQYYGVKLKVVSQPGIGTKVSFIVNSKAN
ncbi:sensor histidine kinase [Bacillus sp. JJ722]|uniref:sensor histidine kinase n=1 Tax=Bacillus sp. JJ722 TaxID=3122973 RepID=UPI002FFE3686